MSTTDESPCRSGVAGGWDVSCGHSPDELFSLQVDSPGSTFGLIRSEETLPTGASLFFSSECSSEVSLDLSVFFLPASFL